MPPTADLVVGIDSSTTSCKAIAWNAAGQLVAEGRAPHTLSQPQPGWHVQNADEWWQALVSALRGLTEQVDARRIAALSIAVQRETFVLVDAQGQPLGPAPVWMDERARDLLPELGKRYSAEKIHQQCGKPLTANLTIAKLLWFTTHMPELVPQTAHVLDVHAFLAQRLTGHFVTSPGCADPTGLLDMPRRDWNTALIEAAGWKTNVLPDLVEIGALAGSIHRQAAQATGLPEGTPLFAGLGDGQAAGLGTGVLSAGASYLNLGTAVVSGTYSAAYRADRAFRTHFGPMLQGQPSYLLETVLLGGTYTIRWLLDTLLPGTSLAALEHDAAELLPGSGGLMLVPYWNSAMNPYWDASASGITVGWRGSHGPAHLYRAILEGIAMEQRLATTAVEAALDQPIQQWIAVGGGSQSTLWPQIIADVTGKPVVKARTTEATALGAGILAALGIGWFTDAHAAAQSMAHHDPQPVLPGEHSAAYDQLYQQVYRHLYPALREPLARLSALTGG